MEGLMDLRCAAVGSMDPKHVVEGLRDLSSAVVGSTGSKHAVEGSTGPLHSVSATSAATSCGDICRICQDGASDEPLLSPCLCRGTIQFVHHSCLQRSLQARNSDTCEICKHKFQVVRKEGSFMKWLLYEMSGPRGYWSTCLIALWLFFALFMLSLHWVSLECATLPCHVNVTSDPVTGLSMIFNNPSPAGCEVKFVICLIQTIILCGISLFSVSLTLVVLWVKFKNWQKSNPRITNVIIETRPTILVC